VDDELVAGIDAESGGFKAGVGDVAVAEETLRVGGGEELHGDFEDTILASQFWWSGDNGAGREACADLVGRVRCRCRSGGALREILSGDGAVRRMRLLRGRFGGGCRRENQ